MQKKLIIFDMDGTILDSSKSITKSINFVRNELGLSPFSVEKITKLINMPDQDLPKLFYEDIKPYSECRKIFEKHYHENCIKDMRLYNGIRELLRELNRDFLLAVATNAYEMFAKKMLEHLEINNYFEMIVGSDTIGARKPDPKVIQYILNTLNINEKEALFVGDSLKDEQAAKNANIKYIFADWGYGECKKPDLTLSLNNLKYIYKII